MKLKIMAISRPFYRTCRQHVGGSYANSGKSYYIIDPRYAVSPSLYVRSFLLIQDDMKKIFEYIEPSDANLRCYSLRLHEIIVRSCIEIEANFKAILTENNYRPRRNLTVADYKKLEQTHSLSGYQIKLPFWRGNGLVRNPFCNWKDAVNLPWYQAYNSVKHNRYADFETASLEHAIDAVSGLACILSAQFYTYDFQPGADHLIFEGSADGFENAIGDYFLIRFPDWPEAKRYDFVWQDIKDEANPFQTLW